MTQKTPLCYAPFVQMLLSPTGKFHPCCYHFGYQVGNAKQHWSDVWNGPKMHRIRQELLDGNPKICRSRIENLSCQNNFSHWQDKVTPVVEQTSSPQRLDVRLNGHCNLKCVMCDVWQQPNGRFDGSSFWLDGPSEIFPFLKEIEILGGEPFIQKDTFRLIELIRSSNQECEFSFISNGQFLNRRAVEKALLGIKVKKIHLSVDSLDPSTFAQIRRGGDFQLLHDNWQFFDQLPLSPETKYVASLCLLQQNWREVPHFIEEVLHRGWIPEIQLAFYDPSASSSVNFLPLDEVQAIKDFLTAAVKVENRLYLNPILATLDQIITTKGKP